MAPDRVHVHNVLAAVVGRRAERVIAKGFEHCVARNEKPPSVG